MAFLVMQNTRGLFPSDIYQDHVNKNWWMTFLVTQNTRGLSPFPSRRSTKMYAKAINIPDKWPWRVPLSWENSARSIPIGKVIGSKVLRCGTEKSLIYSRTFQLPAQFSETYLAKCLHVNRALSFDENAWINSLKGLHCFKNAKKLTKQKSQKIEKKSKFTISHENVLVAKLDKAL